MERVVLISDIDTELGMNLLKQYYANHCKIIGTSTTAVNNLDISEFNTEYVEIVPWNRISPVGAKNVLIKGITRFREIQEVLILQTAGFISSQLTGLSVLEIEQCIDMWSKGTCFLVREVLGHLQQQNRGCISLVNNVYYKDNDAVSPLRDILEAGFKALAKNLLQLSKESQITINCFESTTIHSDKFSEYIYKTNTERTGKLSGRTFSYHDKKFFLAGIRNN